MKSDRPFAAVVVLCLVLLGGIVVVGLRDRPSADGAGLTPVQDRPEAAVGSAAEAPVVRDRRARTQMRRLAGTGGVIVEGELGERLRGLRGAPVIVNMWASWCASCRAEFGEFATVSRRYAGKVAFLGLDAGDDRGDAEAFLREVPLPYPSIFDPKAEQAREIGAGRGWPTTVFFDARGRRTFVRQGIYTSAAQLDADVRAYALRP